MGTTAYCAPEQLQGSDLDGRADQYALGCTAFNLLTGSAPFQRLQPGGGHHPAFVRAATARSVSADPNWQTSTARSPKRSPKNPDDRYPTCADFAAALGSQLNTAAAEVAGPTRSHRRIPTEVIAAPQSASPAPPKARSSRLGRRSGSRRSSPSRWSGLACSSASACSRGESAPTGNSSARFAFGGAAGRQCCCGPGDAGDQAIRPTHRSIGCARPPRVRRGEPRAHQALQRSRHPAVGGVRQELRRPQAVQVGRGHHARQQFHRQRRHPGRRDRRAGLLLPGAGRGDQRKGHRSRNHSPRPHLAGRFPARMGPRGDSRGQRIGRRARAKPSRVPAARRRRSSCDRRCGRRRRPGRRSAARCRRRSPVVPNARAGCGRTSRP